MTAAVWWPNRHDELSTLEYQYADFKHSTHGTEIIGYHLGCLGSSSRAEIIGLALAAYANRPLHLALDNLYVVNHANKYIRHVQKYGATKWHYIYRVILARGPHSIKVSKTKGHAFQDKDYMNAIRNDPIKMHAARQNRTADVLAGAAREHFFNKNVVDLSYLLADRQKSYTTFMVA
eukprot:2170445-Karenia_brevis.AAC.1